jgi:hypothetical protein
VNLQWHIVGFHAGRRVFIKETTNEGRARQTQEDHCLLSKDFCLAIKAVDRQVRGLSFFRGVGILPMRRGMEGRYVFQRQRRSVHSSLGQRPREA